VIKMMIGLLAAMVFVLAVQAQAEEEIRQKHDMPVVDQNTQGELWYYLTAQVKNLDATDSIGI
jgi:hypothetical protein